MALRFQSNHDFTDVPIPTTTTRHAPQQSTGATIRRAKTLTRPERQVAPVPLINPQTAHTSSPTAATTTPNDYNGSEAWRIFTRVVTFWAPAFLLSSLGGLKDKATQQAWREKMTLCFIIMLLCGGLGFITVGFQAVLCPQTDTASSQFVRLGERPGILGVQGHVYNVSSAGSRDNVDFLAMSSFGGQDVTYLFQRTASEYTECAAVPFNIGRDEPCSSTTPCTITGIHADASSLSSIGFQATESLVGYSWDQVSALPNFMVIDGAVLNLGSYFTQHPSAVPGDKVDTALRALMQRPNGGKDGTRLFYTKSDLTSAVPCLKQRYYAGNIDKVTPGCFISQLILYAGLIVILSLVFIRFAMACIFSWFLSERLAGPPDSKYLASSAISPAVMPEGANVSIDSKHGTAPWAGPGGAKKLTKGNSNKAKTMNSSSSTLVNSDGPQPVMTLSSIGRELFAVCLVTCYSEGEDSLRTTLDSLSNTTYSDQRKLLFVVADGMITGAGEKKSTPDICVSLLEADPRFGNPTPMLYGAVGSGAKQQNRAMVYAGHYSEPSIPSM